MAWDRVAGTATQAWIRRSLSVKWKRCLSVLIPTKHFFSWKTHCLRPVACMLPWSPYIFLSFTLKFGNSTPFPSSLRRQGRAAQNLKKEEEKSLRLVWKESPNRLRIDLSQLHGLLLSCLPKLESPPRDNGGNHHHLFIPRIHHHK